MFSTPILLQFHLNIKTQPATLQIYLQLQLWAESMKINYQAQKPLTLMEMMHKLMRTANFIQNKHYFTVQDDEFLWSFLWCASWLKFNVNNCTNIVPARYVLFIGQCLTHARAHRLLKILQVLKQLNCFKCDCFGLYNVNWYIHNSTLVFYLPSCTQLIIFQ